MDQDFRKLIRPMDARGLQGVFSRGKPVYRGVSNSPKPKDRTKAKRNKIPNYREAIIERFNNERFANSKSNGFTGYQAKRT